LCGPENGAFYAYVYIIFTHSKTAH